MFYDIVYTTSIDGHSSRCKLYCESISRDSAVQTLVSLCKSKQPNVSIHILSICEYLFVDAILNSLNYEHSDV